MILSQLKLKSRYFSNWSKTCNIAATCMTFCDKQRGHTLVRVKKFKHAAAILQGLEQFEHFQSFG